MQKFVVKKISRSTNITISTTDDQTSSTSAAGEATPLPPKSDLEISSVKMAGWLKKKRNVS